MGDTPTVGDTPTEYDDTPTVRPFKRGQRGFTSGDVIVGRYVVMDKLGEGGMGVVYKCFDQVGGVEVAVKGLPPEVCHDAGEMEEIRANYQIVGNLHHQNIVGARTLEEDEATGDFYLVMDLASGMNLKRWMRHNPHVSMEVKLSILRQVAAALDFAHSQKVIHRDVKPENVMVDDEGCVKVLDFGLAAQIRSSQSRTRPAETSRSGTPGYKSPEQWLGYPQRASADEYSFGVLAYWMLAGELPFDGDDPAILGRAVLTAPVRPVSGIPKRMNVVLAKALAKKPEKRFASCGRVVDALEAKGSFVGKILMVVVALGLVAAGIWWWNESVKTELDIRPEQLTPDSAKPKSDPAKPKSGPAKPKSDPAKPKSDPAKPKSDPAKPKSKQSMTGQSRLTLTNEWNVVTNENPNCKGRPRIVIMSPDKQTELCLVWCGAIGDTTNGFWMGETEVTRRQWCSVMGEVPSSATDSSDWQNSDYPATSVTWDDCTNFIKRLSEKTSLDFSLPDSNRWVVACLSGSTNDYWWGDHPVKEGKSCGNFGGEDWRTLNVAGNEEYPPNDWGLYDMHGNAAEWCNEGFYFGGSYLSLAKNCTARSNTKGYEGSTGKEIGFRVFLNGGRNK